MSVHAHKHTHDYIFLKHCNLILQKGPAVPIHAKEAQRGGRGIAIAILDSEGVYEGVGGQRSDWAALPWGKINWYS